MNSNEKIVLWALKYLSKDTATEDLAINKRCIVNSMTVIIQHSICDMIRNCHKINHTFGRMI